MCQGGAHVCASPSTSQICTSKLQAASGRPLNLCAFSRCCLLCGGSTGLFVVHLVMRAANRPDLGEVITGVWVCMWVLVLKSCVLRCLKVC